MRTRLAVALLSAAFVSEAYSTQAAATVVDVNEIAVLRNGTTSSTTVLTGTRR
jgi:hypothetical protein